MPAEFCDERGLGHFALNEKRIGVPGRLELLAKLLCHPVDGSERRAEKEGLSTGCENERPRGLNDP